MARAGFTASKILWLKRHEPETFAAVRHILLPAGYVNWCLTGQKVRSEEGLGFRLKPRGRRLARNPVHASWLSHTYAGSPGGSKALKPGVQIFGSLGQ